MWYGFWVLSVIRLFISMLMQVLLWCGYQLFLFCECNVVLVLVSRFWVLVFLQLVVLLIWLVKNRLLMILVFRLYLRLWGLKKLYLIVQFGCMMWVFFMLWMECMICSCMLNGRDVEMLLGYSLWVVRFFGLRKIWWFFLLVK